MIDPMVRKLILSLEAAGASHEEAGMLMAAIDDAGLALTDGQRVACPVTETLPTTRKAIAGLRGVYLIEVEHGDELIRLLEDRREETSRVTPFHAF